MKNRSLELLPDEEMYLSRFAGQAAVERSPVESIGIVEAQQAKHRQEQSDACTRAALDIKRVEAL